MSSRIGPTINTDCSTITLNINKISGTEILIKNQAEMYKVRESSEKQFIVDNPKFRRKMQKPNSSRISSFSKITGNVGNNSNSANNYISNKNNRSIVRQNFMVSELSENHSCK